MASVTNDLGDAWLETTRRNARSVQTTIGWIFWDPGAADRYRALGLPDQLAGPLGYIAARSAPLAGAGAEAVIASFGSISPAAIRGAFQLVGGPEKFQQVWAARDEAVVEGLHRYAPDIVDPLREFATPIWEVVDRLPMVGRVFFGAHLAVPRPGDPLLSGWHAVNCLREWRGDTHWAIVVANGLTHAEASILHNAWLGYETDWLAKSRGTSVDDLDAGWNALEAKGLAENRIVLPAGVALRQELEDETDRLTALPWQLIGAQRAREFAERFEPPCVRLLQRVNETAGPNYQPASRIRASKAIAAGNNTSSSS
jgi:hypothetical protein